MLCPKWAQGYLPYLCSMKLPETIQPAAPRPKAEVRLDANESPFNTSYNAYPEADYLLELKREWGKHERIPESCIYFCNGTEEAVDLVMRAFALEGRDSVAAAEPTRSIYCRRAAVNRLEYREAPLRKDDFALEADALLNVVSDTTSLLFLCSPNSPTGNLLSAGEVETILQLFDGYVVVDESYIEFCPQHTMAGLLNKYRNLILLRSFSHGWSAAGLRLAAIVARPETINEIAKVGFTHPLSSAVERVAMQMVRQRLDVDKWVRQILDERTKVVLALRLLPECKQVYPSDANFLLVRFADSEDVANYLLQNGIAVRPACGCLRITIGLPSQNSALLGLLRRRIER